MEGSAALKSAAICVGIGGVPFSICLYRLGIDIVSAELLHYLLLAMPVFIIVFAVVVSLYGSHNGWAFTVTCVGLSLCMCVPLEIAAYVLSNWDLRRTGLDLPAMTLIFSVWAIIVGLISALIVWTFRVWRRHGF